MTTTAEIHNQADAPAPGGLRALFDRNNDVNVETSPPLAAPAAPAAAAAAHDEEHLSEPAAPSDAPPPDGCPHVLWLL